MQAVEPGKVDPALSRSGELHALLWEQAAAAADRDAHSILTGLFIQSLNELIDLHSKRVMIGLGNRIPGTIWLTLYCVAALSMAALGYQEGLADSKRSPVHFALVVAFAGVLLLIADLDRPHEGASRSQQPMIELRNMLNQPGG